MKVITPTPVTEGMLSAYNAVNADADWNIATAYTVGQQVSYSHVVYKCLVANTGKQPDLNIAGVTTGTVYWVTAGPTNKWAMFDGAVTTRTTRAASLSVTIAAGVVFDSLALLNSVFSSVTATIKDSFGVVKWSKTIYTDDSSLMVKDWYDYFFLAPNQRTEMTILGIPPYADGTLTLDFTSTNTVAVGMVVLGVSTDIGIEQFGAKVTGTDYSRVTFDEFGAVTILRRGYAKALEVDCWLTPALLDRVNRALSDVASLPVVCVADRTTYDTLTIYGLVSFSISLDNFSESLCSIEVKGLL